MRHDPEVRLMQLAARQHTAFTRRQALDVGMSRSTIQLRIDRGLWLPMFQGTYVLSASARTWRRSLSAACLACGNGALASHRSAAAVYGLLDDVDVPQITIPVSAVRKHVGITVYRSRSIEVARKGGFRITTPVRTLLDLAGSETDEDLEHLLDAAHRRRLVTLGSLEEALQLPRNATRRGSGKLREMVAARDPSRPIESELETDLFALLRRCGLPLPVPQFWVKTRNGDRRIDFAYPDICVAIEIDSFEWHDGRQAFDRDRVRQNDLVELGWSPRRFTKTQIREAPSDVAFTIGTALGLVPARWRPS